MSEEKKLALLIDSDNVSAKYAPFILSEAAKYGELTCKRVYGDWEKGGNGWHFPAINNAILPVQQTCYIAGKNATDFSMIIDAMDLLYSGTVDGFVLVTSDSDFTRLAIRLREAGKLVVGIGEVKTPLAFTSSCHHFSFLNQVCDSVGDYDEKTLREAVLDFVKNSGDKGTDLAKIDSFLTSRYGNVDYNLLGFKRFSSFVDSFPELRRNNTFVLMKKKPAPTPAPAPKTPLTLEKVTAAIKDYLAEHGAERDNMMALERHVNSLFGKIDYSKFGTQGEPISKRFSKFIDKIPGIVRDGTSISLAAPEDTEETDLTTERFKAEVIRLVGSNPNGINLGLLNSNLQAKFGKYYLKELGFSDFAAALDAIPEIKCDNHNVYTVEKASAAENSPAVEAAPEEIPEQSNRSNQSNQSNQSKQSKQSKQPKQSKQYRQVEQPEQVEQTEQIEQIEQAEQIGQVEQAEQPEQSEPTEQSDNLPETEKPEINAVKRFILSNTAQSEGGIVLPALGKILSQHFGKSYLKELGFRTLKQLVGSMTGVEIRDNHLVISEEFIERTDEIERLVYDFARSEGSRSVRALSAQIKKNFPGFDFGDYGYGKFSDFINAIDGVRANGYYVEPVEN